MTVRSQDLSQGTPFTLNSREVVALPGESLLQAAQRQGVEIPHLCHKEGLRPDGNCRACVVEIEGERVLAPSCCRAPTAGMQVKTDSERARHAQKMVLELLQSDAVEGRSYTMHSELDQWSEKLELGKPRFPGRSQPASDLSHPAISVNRTPASSATAACVPVARNRATT